MIEYKKEQGEKKYFSGPLFQKADKKYTGRGKAGDKMELCDERDSDVGSWEEVILIYRSALKPDSDKNGNPER